jgi:hypothetical protein
VHPGDLRPKRSILSLGRKSSMVSMDAMTTKEPHLQPENQRLNSEHLNLKASLEHFQSRVFMSLHSTSQQNSRTPRNGFMTFVEQLGDLEAHQGFNYGVSADLLCPCGSQR